jgi:hypothetical protein
MGSKSDPIDRLPNVLSYKERVRIFVKVMVPKA